MRNKTRIPDALFARLLQVVGCTAPFRVVYGPPDAVSGQATRSGGIVLRIPSASLDKIDMAYLILDVMVHEVKHWLDYSTPLHFDYDAPHSRRPQERRAERAVVSFRRRVMTGRVAPPDAVVLELAENLP